MKAHTHIIFVVVGILFMLAACKSSPRVLPVLPVNEVGDTYLTEEIAPVKAPFAMPELKKPVFPDTIVRLCRTDVSDYMQTDYINRRINELSKAGGGTVSLEHGKWQSGRIELKSNINLHVPEGTEIHFSGEAKDYLPVVFTKFESEECLSSGAFIYANNQDNIALTGRGKLVGPPLDGVLFHSFWEQFNNRTMKKIDPDTPVEERIYDGSAAGIPMFLPKTFSPINCKNVLVEGIRIEGSLTWNIAPIYCENVIIRGINVYSVGVPTGDGIDIESSKNVLIEYSTLSNGDDCFTVKAGRGRDGLRVNKPSENIVIRYCLALEGHGGVTCGSETAAGIKNLYVHDCVFDNTMSGLRFKTRRGRGGGGDSLYFERIRMKSSVYALHWDMLGSQQFMGELAERYPLREVTPLTPAYRNISMKDIVIENTKRFIDASGIPESPLFNVRIENITVSCEKLPRFTDVDGFYIKNVQVTSQDSIMELVDARNITFDNVDMNLPGELQMNKTGHLTGNITIK